MERGSSKRTGARAVKLGARVKKAGTQAVELRIRAWKPETGGQAVALDGEVVNSGSAAGILDGQLGARADVIETRVVRWGINRSVCLFSPYSIRIEPCDGTVAGTVELEVGR